MRISDWSSDVCSSDLPTSGSVSAKLVMISPRAIRGSHAAFCASVPAITSPWLPIPTLVPKEIGRASCRERVCQYVSISVVAVSLKKQIIKKLYTHYMITKSHYCRINKVQQQ